MSEHPPRLHSSAFDIPVPHHCRALIERGALVALSTSGGKDSQAMAVLLSRIVPRDQLLAVHAPLGEVEWPGTIEHIEATLPVGVPLIYAPVASGKTLLERVEERGMWPSNSIRWCTSDFKTGPIERELRRYLKAHPRFGGRLVNAMGMRSGESPARARKRPWRKNDRMSVAGREVYDWLPIFDLSTNDVFRVIRDAGQSPHWAYAASMSRLSCVFCIMASRSDLRTAAQLQPSLYRRYSELERRIGHTLSPSRIPLPELTGIPVEPARTSISSSRCIQGRNAGHLTDGLVALRTEPFPRPLGSRGGGASSRGNRPSCVSSRSRRPGTPRSRR